MSDQETANLANNMRRSRIAWLWYVLMRTLMVIESVLWTGMDLVRGLRMRVAGKINSNYRQQ